MKTTALKGNKVVLQVRLPKRMTAAAYQARFAAEKASLRRYYCNVFEFWRACPYKPCRKARACSGDAAACLKRGEADVPRKVQWNARQKLLQSTPANIGAPERLARQFMPNGLCD